MRHPIWFRAAAAVFGLTLAYAYWLGWSKPYFGGFHDDGIYAVTAKALAEGRGYRILSLPGEIPQTKYPVLFPAALAAVWKISPEFPGNLPWLKAVPLGFAALWCWVVFRWVRRETKQEAAALWMALLVAAAPWVYFSGITLVSESMFACLCWAALLHDGEEGREVNIAAVLASAAFHTRAAGVAVIFALAGALLLRRQYRSAARFLLLCGLLTAPWFLWQAMHPGATGVFAYYTKTNYSDWHVMGNFTAAQRAAILSGNLAMTLLAPKDMLRLTFAAVPLSLAIMLIALVGFCADVRRGVRAVHLFVAASGATVMLWAWPPHRFLLPLTPCLIYFGWRGLSILCRRAPAIVAVAGLVLGANMCRGVMDDAARPSSYAGRQPWMETRRAMDWIKVHTPPGARVMFRQDPALYLFTGRQSVRAVVLDPYLLFYAGRPMESMGTAEDLRRTVVEQRLTYIVQGGDTPSTESRALNGLIDEMIRRHPEAFRLRYQGGMQFRVYEADLARLAPPLVTAK